MASLMPPTTPCGATRSAKLGTGLAADGNGNNSVDAGDYTVWKTHFGETAGSGSGASAIAPVPEPTTLVLFLVALVASFTIRRTAVS